MWSAKARAATGCQYLPDSRPRNGPAAARWMRASPAGLRWRCRAHFDALPGVDGFDHQFHRARDACGRTVALERPDLNPDKYQA
jgi:hypothetical protein